MFFSPFNASERFGGSIQKLGETGNLICKSGQMGLHSDLSFER